MLSPTFSQNARLDNVSIELDLSHNLLRENLCGDSFAALLVSGHARQSDAISQSLKERFGIAPGAGPDNLRANHLQILDAMTRKWFTARLAVVHAYSRAVTCVMDCDEIRHLTRTVITEHNTCIGR